MAISSDGLDVDGIGHFLSDHFLAVPTNQRSYAWERDNVEDFWHDILNAESEEHASDYFIGSIVLSETDRDVLEITDGQQRLATTTIILGAIRDYFLENTGDDRARLVENKYLISPNEDTLELEPRLTLNTEDNVFFRDNVVQRSKTPRRENPIKTRQNKKSRPKDSHKKIADAIMFIREQVYRLVNGRRPAEATNRLMRIVKYIRDHVKIIGVIVPGHEDAYTIFETLNDRGLELSKADLLKNHLFRSSRRHLGDVESKWHSMTAALETVSRKDITVDYIRYLWISSHGHVREKELYKKIKAEISEQREAVDFSHELADSAEQYAAILNSDHPRWNEYGDTARADLSNLIMLGVERMHPITLAVSRKFSVKEARKALRYLVCTSVRILIAAPPPGGEFEKQVALVAPAVSNGTIKNAKELAVEMNKKIAPADAEFEAAFATANVSRTDLARYYLRALENGSIGDDSPATVSKEQAKGTLEHILPINPSGAWSHVPADIAKAYYKRIGNLALLSAKANSDIGNKDFLTEKVPVYRTSVLTLTQEIAAVAKWDDQEIEKRQKRLATLAVKTWPIDVK